MLEEKSSALCYMEKAAISDFQVSGLNRIDLVDLRDPFFGTDSIISDLYKDFARESRIAEKFLEDNDSEIQKKLHEIRKIYLSGKEEQLLPADDPREDDLVKACLRANAFIFYPKKFFRHGRYFIDEYYDPDVMAHIGTHDRFETWLLGSVFPLVRQVISDSFSRLFWRRLSSENPFKAAWLKTASNRKRFVLIVVDFPAHLAAYLRHALVDNERIPCGLILSRNDSGCSHVSEFLEHAQDAMTQGKSSILSCDDVHAMHFYERARFFVVNPPKDNEIFLRSGQDAIKVLTHGTKGTRFFLGKPDSFSEIPPSDLGLAEVIRVADELCGIRR